MSSSVDLFHKLPHNNQHYTNNFGLHGSNLIYHLCFDPKLGKGRCEIIPIPFSCNVYTYKLDLPWNPTLCDDKQPIYQTPKINLLQCIGKIKSVEHHHI